MTTTLARRIRRIGILPTTYKEVKETFLKVNEEGAEVEMTHIKKVPVRHYKRIDAATRAKLADDFRIEAKKKRLAARNK